MQKARVDRWRGGACGASLNCKVCMSALRKGLSLCCNARIDNFFIFLEDILSLDYLQGGLQIVLLEGTIDGMMN